MSIPSDLTTYSFQDSNQTLQLVGGYGSIPWIEHVQDEAPSAMQLSRLQNSQAVMTYMTSAHAVYQGGVTAQGQSNPGLREALYTTILGGYFQSGGLKHQPPLRHPFCPGMYAVEISDIKFKKYNKEVESVQNSGQLSFAAYEIAYISINFQTLPFVVNRQAAATSGGMWNPNWISIESNNTNTYTNSPIGLYRYTEGPYSGLPASRGINIRKPEGKLDVVIHNVFHDLIFSGAGAPWASLLIRTPTVTYTGLGAVSSPAGFINNAEFLGCREETLLLDAIDLLPVGDIGGVGRYYNMRLRLLYNGWGWNRVLDPSGNPRKIASFLGSIPPFSSVSFVDLFNNFNPVNSIVTP